MVTQPCEAPSTFFWELNPQRPGYPWGVEVREVSSGVGTLQACQHSRQQGARYPTYSSCSNLCVPLSGTEKSILSGFGLYPHTQEGNDLILLLARVLLAQEEAEQGAWPSERGSLLAKSLADTMTSFLPPAV